MLGTVYYFYSLYTESPAPQTVVTCIPKGLIFYRFILPMTLSRTYL